MRKRIQRKRVKGWKMPENTKYVGRPTKWGNPFKLQGGMIYAYSTKRKHLSPWILFAVDDKPHTLEEVVCLYEDWLLGKFTESHPYLPTPPNQEEWEELAGKNLACWCNLMDPCHVDILMDRIP